MCVDNSSKIQMFWNNSDMQIITVGECQAVVPMLGWSQLGGAAPGTLVTVWPISAVPRSRSRDNEAATRPRPVSD